MATISLPRASLNAFASMPSTTPSAVPGRAGITALPLSGAAPMNISPRAASNVPAGLFPAPTVNPFNTTPPAPAKSNGLQPLATTDQVNPGYGEQALQQTQNQLQTDPFGSKMAALSQQASTPTAGQSYVNQNLGSLDGPGAGQQQWNQTAGQFNSPFAGENFTQQATAGMAPSGPATDFFNQAMQNYSNNGQYNGPNLAAGQYAQTGQSFGALPTPDSADPFYDRAVQLGTQSYNQQAAGRGVYGSSETLNGVGNMVSGLEAQRAQTAFGNSMEIAKENRAREELLGNQARQGDLSSLGAFGANIAGTQTYGNLASQADNSQTNRYQATTSAMNAADRTALDRLNSGSDQAFKVDATNLNNYTAQNNAAIASGNLDTNRTQTAATIANQGSQNDLSRLNAYNNAAQGAEGQRQTRVQSQINATQGQQNAVINALSDAQKQLLGSNQQAFDDWYNANILPAKQAAGMSEAEIQADRAQVQASFTTAMGPVNTAVAKST